MSKEKMSLKQFVQEIARRNREINATYTDEQRKRIRSGQLKFLWIVLNVAGFLILISRPPDQSAIGMMILALINVGGYIAVSTLERGK